MYIVFRDVSLEGVLSGCKIGDMSPKFRKTGYCIKS